MGDPISELQAIKNEDGTQYSNPTAAARLDKLSTYTLDDLGENIELHRLFIEAARTYAVFQNESPQNLLRVANDGVYEEVLENPVAALYEIIQNVDDSFLNFPNPNLGNGPHLSMDFDLSGNRDQFAKITLEYNESGFRPVDVLSVFVIGYSPKSKEKNRKTIGHKGVGFKSIFNIVKKVWIHSGYFSFELTRHEKTLVDENGDLTVIKGSLIPEVNLSVKNSYPGTKMVLELDWEDCNELYTNHVSKFFSNNAALESNPLLFLRNLTEITMTCGSSKSVFSKSRFNVGDEVDNDIHIVKDQWFKYQRNDEVSEPVFYDFYYQNVSYPRELYLERDGKASAGCEILRAAVVQERSRSLIGFGGLYAGLPTNVRTVVPISLDIPFHLDQGRFYPDKKYPKWTEYTHGVMKIFLEGVYKSLSELHKQDIVNYLPSFDESFFRYNEKMSDSGKLSVLVKKGENLRYSGEWVCSLPIFYVEGMMRSIEEISCFVSQEHIEDQGKVARWIGMESEIFLTPGFTDMSKYGCEKLVSGVKDKLIGIALSDKDYFGEILAWLENHRINCTPDPEYYPKGIFGNHRLYEKFNDRMVDAVLSTGSLVNLTEWQEILFNHALRRNSWFERIIEWLGKDVDLEIFFDNCSDLLNVRLNEEKIRVLLKYGYLANCDNLCTVMFRSAITIPSLFGEVVSWIEENGAVENYLGLFPSEFTITKEKLDIILGNEHLRETFTEINKQVIKKVGYSIRMGEGFEDISPEKMENIEDVDRSGLLPLLRNYLEDPISHELSKVVKVFDYEKKLCLFCKNGILLSKQSTYSSLGDMVRDIKMEGDESRFSFRLRLKENYDALDRYDSEALCDEAYLLDLQEMKKDELSALSRVFGSPEVILPKVQKRTKFISELMQNAEDAEYGDNEPEFNMVFDANTISIETNELGFKRKHVKAITDIGNSTKVDVGEHDYFTIGNKGIGFKTVFSVAERVEIHSKKAHFEIRKNEPILPYILHDNPFSEKTRIILHLGGDQASKSKVFDEINNYLDNEDSLLNLCICLDKFRRITLGKHKIIINGDDTDRKIVIDGKIFEFTVFRKDDCKITDKDALRDRYGENHAKVQAEFKISAYMMKENYKAISPLVHAGLPISDQYYSSIPIIFNLPLELNNERELVISNSWNSEVLEFAKLFYLSILKRSRNLKYRLFDYIPAGFQPFGKQIVDDILKDPAGPKDIAEYIKSNIEKIEFVPVFDARGSLCSPGVCTLVPDYFLTDRSGPLNGYITGKIADLTDKSAESCYLKLLKLGASSVKDDEIRNYLINEFGDFSKIGDDQFRTNIYTYLAVIKNKDIRKDIAEKIRLIPLDTVGGREFVKYTKPVYYAKKNEGIIPDDDHPILIQEVLDKDLLENILADFGNCIELTPSLVVEDFRGKIKDRIKGNNPEEDALFLKNKFDQIKDHPESNLYNALKDELKLGYDNGGLPLRRGDSKGSYQKGKYYLNHDEVGRRQIDLEGKLLTSMEIHKDFVPMAYFFGATSITRVDGDSFEGSLPYLSIQDLVDLSNTKIIKRQEIIRKFADSERIALINKVDQGNEGDREDIFNAVRNIFIDYPDRAVELFTLLSKEPSKKKLSLSRVPLKMLSGIPDPDFKYYCESDDLPQGDYLKAHCIDTSYFQTENPNVLEAFKKVFCYYKLKNMSRAPGSEVLSDQDILDICDFVDDPSPVWNNLTNNRIDLVSRIDLPNLTKDQEANLASRVRVLLAKGGKVKTQVEYILNKCTGNIPCKNAYGESTTGPLYTYSGDVRKFKGTLLRKRIIHADFLCLQDILKSKDIREITPDDILRDNVAIGLSDFEDLCILNPIRLSDIVDKALPANGAPSRLEIVNIISTLEQEDVAEYFRKLLSGNSDKNLIYLITCASQRNKPLQIPCLNLSKDPKLHLYYYKKKENGMLVDPDAVVKGSLFRSVIADKDYFKLAKALGSSDIADLKYDDFKNMVPQGDLTLEDVLDLDRLSVKEPVEFVRKMAAERRLDIIRNIDDLPNLTGDTDFLQSSMEGVYKGVVEFYNSTKGVKSLGGLLKVAFNAANCTSGVPFLMMNGSYGAPMVYRNDVEDLDLSGSLFRDIVLLPDKMSDEIAFKLDFKTISDYADNPLIYGKDVTINDLKVAKTILKKTGKYSADTFRKLIESLADNHKLKLSESLQNDKSEVSADVLKASWAEDSFICGQILEIMNEKKYLDFQDLPVYCYPSGITGPKVRKFTNQNNLPLKGNLIRSMLIDSSQYPKGNISSVLNRINKDVFKDISKLKLEDFGDGESFSLMDLVDLHNLNPSEFPDFVKALFMDDRKHVEYLWNAEGTVDVRAEKLADDWGIHREDYLTIVAELRKQDNLLLPLRMLSGSRVCRHGEECRYRCIKDFSNDELRGEFIKRYLVPYDVHVAKDFELPTISDIKVEKLEFNPQEPLSIEDIFDLRKIFKKDEKFAEAVTVAIGNGAVALFNDLGRYTDVGLLNSLSEKFLSSREFVELVLNALDKDERTRKAGLIPIKLATSEEDCRTGSVYTSPSTVQFEGILLNRFIAHPDYMKLAKVVFRKGIKDITAEEFMEAVNGSSSIAENIRNLSDADLRDLKKLKNYSKIMSRLANVGLIDSDDSRFTWIFDDIPEEVDLASVGSTGDAQLEQIRHSLETGGYNTIRKIQVEEMKPEEDAGEVKYLQEEYRASKNRYWCQMCLVKRTGKYFEPITIEPLPKYAWKQTYLHLCASCRIWYHSAVSEGLWSDFLENMSQAEVSSENIIKVDIGLKTIQFTRRHFLEAREILKTLCEDYPVGGLSETYNETNGQRR